MKRITLALVSILTITFMSCQDEAGTETSIEAALSVADLDTEESVDASYEDIDDITEAGMEDVAALSQGRFNRRDVLECAEVTHDTVNQTIEIVYDSLSGCSNPSGRVRHGKILVSYNSPRYEIGAYREVTFEDFYLDDIKVEGTRRIENITGSSEDAPKFQITITGGQLTFADGTTITRDVDHIRTWYRSENPQDDYVTLEGTASGSRRDGVSYTAEITEALTFMRSCRNQGFIPVSGTKVITGESTITMDFGDGTCDNLVDVTTDGVTETIEINPRGHRRRG
ncbi:MAG: hypothetical protein NXI20_18825 [bacterium]|nr:hypothetical protein [bacterium]